jgi:hypothetical protein
LFSALLSSRSRFGAPQSGGWQFCGLRYYAPLSFGLLASAQPLCALQCGVLLPCAPLVCE